MTANDRLPQDFYAVEYLERREERLRYMDQEKVLQLRERRLVAQLVNFHASSEAILEELQEVRESRFQLSKKASEPDWMAEIDWDLFWEFIESTPQPVQPPPQEMPATQPAETCLDEATYLADLKKRIMIQARGRKSYETTWKILLCVYTACHVYGATYLSCRWLGGECGVSYQTAARKLILLTEMGIIEKIDCDVRHKHAAMYRWVDD